MVHLRRERRHRAPTPLVAPTPWRLTVTDNRGATGTTTRSVTVPAGALADIQFRAATQANGNSSSVSVAVPPGTCRTRYALVLFVSSASSATPTTPAGWTSVNTTTTDVLRSTLYGRIAAANGAGSTVTVQLGAFGKTTAILSAYSGSTPAIPGPGVLRRRRWPDDAYDAAGERGGRAAVVSYWVDRSSATETGWTVPAAVVERIESLGSGGGRHTAALADYGTPVGPGTFGGVTATAAASSSRAVSWSVVLTAAQL